MTGRGGPPPPDYTVYPMMAHDSLFRKPWLPAYAPGVPAEIVPPTQTLVEMIQESAGTYRDAMALDFFGATTSYRSSVSRSPGRGRSAGTGVRAGDRVALVLPNCPQHVVAFYAVLRLGAIVVEHNPLYTERELRHQFEDHGARVADRLGQGRRVVRELPPRHGRPTPSSPSTSDAMPPAAAVAASAALCQGPGRHGRR